jgi:fermentation-respiration switch protein FrsA (DUF1100 family)
MLFHPTRGQPRTPAALGMPFEDVWLRATDGTRTQAWWIPGTGRPFTLVFFHGNAGVMADRLENARQLHELGVSLLMAEYRGYGDSDGKPSEQGLFADAEAALSEARRRAAGSKVVVFGRSLGGAVAIDLAARQAVDGLIVESTFTSLPDMADTTGLPLARRFVSYRFDSLGKMPRVTAPVLLVHGDADEVVPFWMGEHLREAARGARSVAFHRVPGGDHNGSWVTGGEPYWQSWSRFLDGLR